MSLLFDASSLVGLIRSPKEHKAGLLREARILDLTYYEVGNAIWKELELLRIMNNDEASKLSNALVKTLDAVGTLKLGAGDFEEILALARREKLSFYDSSYLYATKKNEMTLVSEDGKLSKIAKKYAPVQSVNSLLFSREQE